MTAVLPGARLTALVCDRLFSVLPLQCRSGRTHSAPCRSWSPPKESTFRSEGILSPNPATVKRRMPTAGRIGACASASLAGKGRLLAHSHQILLSPSAFTPSSKIRASYGAARGRSCLTRRPATWFLFASISGRRKKTRPAGQVFIGFYRLRTCARDNCSGSRRNTEPSSAS
jgi:hypothetical protein